MSGPFEAYGQPLASATAADVDIADVLAAPERFGDAPLVVRGVVSAVCQRRGCWLELAPAEAANAEDATPRGCRVVAEHHDWFVPRDAAGSVARVQGRVQLRTIPAAQVAHMESEGGRFAHKAQDGSSRELRIVSSGVELARR